MPIAPVANNDQNNFDNKTFFTAQTRHWNAKVDQNTREKSASVSVNPRPVDAHLKTLRDFADDMKKQYEEGIANIEYKYKKQFNSMSAGFDRVVSDLHDQNKELSESLSNSMSLRIQDMKQHQSEVKELRSDLIQAKLDLHNTKAISNLKTNIMVEMMSDRSLISAGKNRILRRSNSVGSLGSLVSSNSMSSRDEAQSEPADSEPADQGRLSFPDNESNRLLLAHAVRQPFIRIAMSKEAESLYA